VILRIIINLSMYLCICKAVSQRAVGHAIANGASSVEEVGQVTSAGTDCGSCRHKIARELERAEGDCDGAEACVVAELAPQPG
jgi:bacterioferritin-associated ferredoxin